jgi:hypothetical protein
MPQQNSQSRMTAVSFPGQPTVPGWPGAPERMIYPQREDSVALVDLPVGPSLARGAVLVFDVALTPADLGLPAGQPVGARGGHLGARAGLRDPVGGAGASG